MKDTKRVGHNGPGSPLGAILDGGKARGTARRISAAAAFATTPVRGGSPP